MIRMYWQQGTDYLAVNLPSGDQISIPVSCAVRNLDNGWRKKDQVVKTIPDEKPYNPKIFPLGKWNITRPIKKTDKYKAPYFIPSNAERFVNVWSLDSRGHYDTELEYQVIDKGYGLHYSESNTTLGCIKIHNKSDLLMLVNLIIAELDRGGECRLEVI